MRILALDTTANFGSIALLDDNEVIEELLLHSPEGFGPIIFGQIERLLQRHSLQVSDIDLFAAAAGPGSFTGVRVGLTAAKGLAEATGRPVAGVSNLTALAECGSGPLRAAILDARRGEIYGAVYDAELSVVRPEVVMPFLTWVDSLPEKEIEFISTDFGPFRAGLAGTQFEQAAVVEQRALAAAIGRTARQLPGEDPAAVDANYVRRSDAELLWKDR
jgi:tRNA threonylcarbamoyladenosine biosynthesis protein TsaB